MIQDLALYFAITIACKKRRLDSLALACVGGVITSKD
jgi:hypothetical protein